MSHRSRSTTQLASLLAASLAFATPAWAGDFSVELDAGGGFVVKNNGGSVERLRVDEATGNVSRNGALFVHTTGFGSTFVGDSAGNTSITGIRNSAFGSRALEQNTTGHSNSAFGNEALASNTTGIVNSAFGARALFVNTTGHNNSAFGFTALDANTTGFFNSAFARDALGANTTGAYNSAFGMSTLTYNTTGMRNSAFGRIALFYNTTANANSAFGESAMRRNTTGYNNSAFGQDALSANTSGDRNVALGHGAGSNQTTGNDNIYIKNNGVAAESGKIKIGNTAHTETFIEGIFGNAIPSGAAVVISAFNELGTVISAARFKQDVEDMGDASELLARLRPVRFRYREAAVGETDAQILQYGLIAEEVAEVAPELVVYDPEGQPYSVRYDVLPALLLNEMQKQQRTIEGQAGVIEEQRQTIAVLAGRLDRVDQQLAAGPEGRGQ